MVYLQNMKNYASWFGAKPHKVQKNKPKSALDKVH